MPEKDKRDSLVIHKVRNGYLIQPLQLSSHYPEWTNIAFQIDEISELLKKHFEGEINGEK